MHLYPYSQLFYLRIKCINMMAATIFIAIVVYILLCIGHDTQRMRCCSYVTFAKRTVMNFASCFRMLKYLICICTENISLLRSMSDSKRLLSLR